MSYEAGGDRFHDWTGTVLTTMSVATVKHGVYTTNGGQTWGPAGGAGNSYVPVDLQFQTGFGITADVRWLVKDQLGTPRMVLDRTGELTSPVGQTGMRRHDYFPFGEEIDVGVGGRATTQGYSQFDDIRNRFTGQQRDDETGLDYFNARYYSATQGRFMSADTFGGKVFNPQTLNLYAYVVNNPLKWIDPTGHFLQDPTNEDDPNKKHAKDENNQIFEVDENDNPTDNPHSIGTETVTVDARPPDLAPSLHDWIPVWGGFRRLLFYNHTGQPERALLSFWGASIDGGTAAVGLVNKGGTTALSLAERAIVRDALKEADVVAAEEILKRSAGGPESASRLGRLAEASLANADEGVHGMKVLPSDCKLRRVQYLNNVIEQDQRAIRRRWRAAQAFRWFHSAERTLEDVEAMHVLRKSKLKLTARYLILDPVEVGEHGPEGFGRALVERA